MRKLLRILFPACIFLIIFTQVDLNSLAQSAKEGDIAILIFSIIASFGLIFLQGLRWYVLSSLLTPPPSLPRLQLINFTAMAFDAFVPGKLGSDAYRILRGTGNGSKSAMVGVLLVLRLQTVIFGGVVAGLSFIFWVWGLWSSLLTLLLLTGVIAILALKPATITPMLRRLFRYCLQHQLIPKRIQEILTTGAETALHVLKSPTLQLHSMLVLSLFIFFNVIVFWLVSIAFKVDIPFTAYLVSVPILLFSANAPFTVHGRGVTELLALYFWGQEGASTEEVLIVCLFVYGISLLQSLSAALALFASGSFQEGIRLKTNEQLK